MVSRKGFGSCWMPALMLTALLFSPVAGQDRIGSRASMPNRNGPNRQGSGMGVSQQRNSRPNRPTYRLAERSGVDSQSPADQLVPSGDPNEHPLMPALRWANNGISNVEKIHDYSATLVKRERINGKLCDQEYMFIKVRHKPFSVYLYFLAPKNLKGREVIYVEGQNDGKMLAHGTGVQNRLLGTIPLAPDGMIAMRGQRYPVTEIGILNLVRRLAEVAEEDVKFGECEVKFLKGATVNKRSCTCIKVIHPVARRNFRFHVAEIFVDDELDLPLRYASYDWPKQPGGAPQLLEEYTYLNLKLNTGLGDADFDTKNPNYNFK